jgi:hypothetical protein
VCAEARKSHRDPLPKREPLLPRPTAPRGLLAAVGQLPKPHAPRAGAAALPFQPLTISFAAVGGGLKAAQEQEGPVLVAALTNVEPASTDTPPSSPYPSRSCAYAPNPTQTNERSDATAERAKWTYSVRKRFRSPLA